RSVAGKTVWTFYWALAEMEPSAGRSFLVAKDWAYWKETILTGLQHGHPPIRACVSRLDVMRIGHAMVRPTVGAVFSAQRQGGRGPPASPLLSPPGLRGAL